MLQGEGRLRHPGLQVSLQLTAEQKERLLAARTYLLAQMMEIIQERTLIISMLQVWPCCNPPSCPARSMPTHGGAGATDTWPCCQRCEAVLLPAVLRQSRALMC